MIRKGIKEKFIQILQNVLLLCENVMEKDADILISALQESQDAVISVGTGLEKTVENPIEIISKMESLCEAFYMLSLNMGNREVYGKQIRELLEEIIEQVSNLPVSYQIVFFPYKAEMWDSLESIWLACKDDPDMDCKVVPIPYYHFDAEVNLWKFHYEIDRFPDYVPVVHYTEYDLSECADVAFVHNPYDEYNHVTHVHSDYYSYNLKKFVDKLFYVPYYVTSGFIAENHKALSVYEHADYIVVQSEAFKEGLIEKGYGHKALVMGSPKLDRVIRMNGNPDCVPEEWKSVLRGKKSLMLNTSLSQFLHDGEIYLQKIGQIIKVVKNRNDVVLIWRPHPLLRSTIESMRPELLSMYENLQEDFIASEVGIIDNTPDVVNTVALVDGYIGEASSSVVNLFEAAGKPVFILNNYITERVSEEEARRVLLSGCNKVGDDYYCTSVDYSNLYVVRQHEWNKISQIVRFMQPPQWQLTAMYNTVVDNRLYITPVFSSEFLMYETTGNKVKQISDFNCFQPLNYRGSIGFKNKVFYIPNITKCIMEYDTISGNWKEYHEPIEAMQSGTKERRFEDVCGYFVAERYLWMTNMYSNRVVCFDMETAKWKMYIIGDKDARYGAAAIDGNILYLSDAYTGEIQLWDYATNKLVDIYKMPDGYQVHRNVLGRCIAHSKLWLADGQLYAIPNTSNMLVKINTVTKEVSIVARELWEDVLEPANYYHHKVCMVANFSCLIDEHTLLVQKRRDASLLEINTHTGNYLVHHPTLAENEVNKIRSSDDGFEKVKENGEFARRENRFFTLDGFIDDLTNGNISNVMIRQKSEMQTMATNLDGTCGKEVYKFIKNLFVY